MGLIANKQQTKIIHFLRDTSVADVEVPWPANIYMTIEDAVLPRLRIPLADGRAELLDADQLPVGTRLRGHIDAGVFRAPRPEPSAPVELTQAEIIKKFFGGDAQAFAAAAPYGFPRPAGYRMAFREWNTDRRPIWWQEDLDRWAAGLRALAAIIK